MTPLKILSVASEVYPLIKTGGLADVTGALPGALAKEGIEVQTLLPGYPQVLAALTDASVVLSFADLFDGPARLLAARAAGLDLLVLDAPHLFARAGGPYASADGRDWPDNPVRFAALSRMAADIGMGALPAYVPDVLHAHDWQAGLMPALLHYRGARRPGTVMTVHNLAFPGKAPPEMLTRLGLPPAAFAIDGVEFHGAISLLKSGLQFADRITTVSPTYAAEIREPEAGMGFEGLLRARSDVLSGILNGIDTAVWDPALDTSIAMPFSRARIAKRAANKAALRKQMGLSNDHDGPLFAVVSRLTWQKGMDLLLPCLPVIQALGGQLALIGAGDHALEAGFHAAAAAAPDQIACFIGYNETLAHLVQAGADALLVPSRFEPCGLTQLCALRYGAVPVVARVGGLADTVIDANEAALAAGVATGLQFDAVSSDVLELTLRRAAALFRQQDVWTRIRKNGMAVDVSWTRPARLYAALYRDLHAARA